MQCLGGVVWVVGLAVTYSAKLPFMHLPEGQMPVVLAVLWSCARHVLARSPLQILPAPMWGHQAVALHAEVLSFLARLPYHPCCSVCAVTWCVLHWQMHHMEDVAVVSIFGTVGMLLAMAVVVGKLLALYITAPAAAPTELVATGQGLNVSAWVLGWRGRAGSRA